jgi:hypothetical protein
MHKDLTLIPDDQPGVLARIGEAAGAAGLNIEGISAFTGMGKGIIHLLVDDPDQGLEVLRGAGFDVRAMRDVVVIHAEDHPGEMGEGARKLADAGVNVEQAYTATQNRVVFVVDDVERARALFA